MILEELIQDLKQYTDVDYKPIEIKLRNTWLNNNKVEINIYDEIWLNDQNLELLDIIHKDDKIILEMEIIRWD